MEKVVGIHQDRKPAAVPPRDVLAAGSRRQPARPPAAAPAPRRAVRDLLGRVQRARHRPGRGGGARAERRGRERCPRSGAAACRTWTAAPSTEAKALIADNVRTPGRRRARGPRHRRARARRARYMLKQEYPWLDGSEDATLVARAHARPVRVPGRPPRRGPARHALSEPAGQDRLSAALPSQGAEHGTSPPTCCGSPGAEVRGGRALLGGRRHLGAQEGVLRAVDEARRAAVHGRRGGAPDRIATDCPLAALQITRARAGRPQHPIRILADAYGLTVDRPRPERRRPGRWTSSRARRASSNFFEYEKVRGRAGSA